MPHVATIDVTVILQGIMVVILGGVALATVKLIIPVGLHIRDGLRDTASELAIMRRTSADHEKRLRFIERRGIGRRQTDIDQAHDDPDALDSPGDDL